MTPTKSTGGAEALTARAAYPVTSISRDVSELFKSKHKEGLNRIGTQAPDRDVSR